ncbi:DegV family protein [Holzapfeliella sp. JNUCC 80]
MKIALVTDSTSYLTKKEIEDNEIVVIPLPVFIDNKEYLENETITADELFEMQRQGASYPKTSQPSIGQLVELYQRLHDEGFEAIISIHLASTISGTVQTLETIKETHPELNLYPYDSRITIRLMGNLVLAAAKMIKNGFTPDQIIERLDQIRDTTDELFALDDLKNLVRGGRLSNASAFVGTMLKIKPLLTFDDETYKIVSFDKVRSTKKAVKQIFNLMNDKLESLSYPVKIMVYHSSNQKLAETLFADVKEQYPNASVEICEFGPIIGAHLGDKTIALTWMVDIDKINLVDGKKPLY